MSRLIDQELTVIGRAVGLSMAQERHPTQAWAQAMVLRLSDAVEAEALRRGLSFKLRDGQLRRLIAAFGAGLAEVRRS